MRKFLPSIVLIVASICSADATEAQKFIDYMRSPEGMAVFKKI